MRILEIELRNWRGLSTTLAGLSPRLNLVLGPNESGKSRIFQALQFGLFESYKGTAQHKQLLQSWASPEPPWVRVVFAEGAAEYELRKQFLKGASVQLTGAGASLQGETAEEALREIFGARPGGSRGAGIGERGIWPLLMVSQGDSRVSIKEHLNEDGRGRLQERLSREIGVAAVSAAGQKLIALAELEFGRYYTASGQEGKALRDARAEWRSAQVGLDTATAVLRRQEQTALDLAHNRQELSELEARCGRAKHDAAAATDRSEAAQAAGGRVAMAQGALDTTAQKVTSLEQSLNARLELDATLERQSAELVALERDLTERLGLERELEQAVQLAEAKFTAGEQLAREARLAVEILQRERRRAQLQTQCQELDARISGLEQIEDAIVAARSRRASLPMVDATILGVLKTLDQNSRAAAARLQGAAVSVLVHVRRAVEIDGAIRSTGETVQLHVVENRRIAIGDLADVEIRPGGGELERLRAAADAADGELKAALLGAGATDLEHASDIHAQRTACDREIAELGRQGRATSTKPLEQLREDRIAVGGELHRLGTDRAVTQDETTLQADLRTAEDSVVRRTSERVSAAAALTEFRYGTAASRASLDTIRAERDRVVKAGADRSAAAQLRAAREQALGERERHQVALAAVKREFSDLGGAQIQVDAKRLAQASDGLAVRARDVRSVGDQLQGALQSMMQAGGYESMEDAGSRFEQACAELTRLEGRAAATKRLWEVLSEERRRVIERLTAPVTARVKPYLQNLFPGSNLDAGEGLDVMGLQSEQLKEPYGELSGGAQEQLSLLTRIGIAEVLAGTGTLPLILDDALINTDPERVKRIHRLLFRAADRLQIILFSCHDVLFDGLGAEFTATLRRRRH